MLQVGATGINQPTNEPTNQRTNKPTNQPTYQIRSRLPTHSIATFDMPIIREAKNLGKYSVFNSRKEKGFIFHYHCSQTYSLAHTASFLRIKGPDYEAVYSPQCNAEVYNKWRSTSVPSLSVFPKISATGDHYMNGRRTGGPLSYPILRSRKGHATALFYLNMIIIVVQVAINHFFVPKVKAFS
jgi:hypothetical protein